MKGRGNRFTILVVGIILIAVGVYIAMQEKPLLSSNACEQEFDAARFACSQDYTENSNECISKKTTCENGCILQSCLDTCATSFKACQNSIKRTWNSCVCNAVVDYHICIGTSDPSSYEDSACPNWKKWRDIGTISFQAPQTP